MLAIVVAAVAAFAAKLAAIHAGDWIVRLLLVTLIVSASR
jgi:hypothetical protein